MLGEDMINLKDNDKERVAKNISLRNQEFSKEDLFKILEEWSFNEPQLYFSKECPKYE